MQLIIFIELLLQLIIIHYWVQHLYLISSLSDIMLHTLGAGSKYVFAQASTE
jgi:hypothetical protein